MYITQKFAQSGLNIGTCTFLLIILPVSRQMDNTNMRNHQCHCLIYVL